MTLEELSSHVGKSIGPSDWIEVDQSMIDEFAACTGDQQWIHVDVERARKQSSAGDTIAHGFLTLALIAPLSMKIGLAPTDASSVLNYGLDRVRFITPVKRGSRVRLQAILDSVEPRGEGQLLMRSKAVIEIESVESPALVAEFLTLVVP